jgi:parallel beta-helix repeat protein
MRGSRVLAAFVIAGLALVLVAVGISSASADESSTESNTALLAPAATIVVTSTADSGPGTLRQALLDAANGDIITFDVAVFPPSNSQTITLASQLPALAQGNLTIDGSNAGVILDGGNTIDKCFYITSTANAIKGLQILRFDWYGIHLDGGASYNVIGGNNATPGGACSGDCNLISGNRLIGIYIVGPGPMSNTISGNYIGTNISGTQVFDNGGNNNRQAGIIISNSANNSIGGDTAGERNLISGAIGQGVILDSSDAVSNTVSGNYIGTNASGTAPISNWWYGVSIGYGASHNLIGGNNGTPGGACTGACNLISGNGLAGIIIQDASTLSNTVSGNYIGTDVSGSVQLGNDDQGIIVGYGTRFHRIGGNTPAERNIISGNGQEGVNIGAASGLSTMHCTVIGNYIGADASGATAIPNDGGVHIEGKAGYNQISGNLISGNDGAGVEIYNLDAVSNTVVGNIIGADASGTASLANTGSGVYIHTDAQYNTVGMSNTIAFNGSHGIQVDGSNTLSNTITRNSIFSNAGDGVHLSNGGNAGLAAPVIVAYDIPAGDVSGTACAQCTIEVFSGFGAEGRYFEGSAVADGGGNWSFSKGGAFTGPVVNATAADAGGNTSQFSVSVVESSIVVSTDDSGLGTLRQALLDATSGTSITFDTHVFSLTNPATITLSSALPEIIIDNLTIDASNAGVILDGSGTPVDTDGLVISGASTVTIKGLQILGFPSDGITLGDGATNNTVEGNVISGNGENGMAVFGAGTMSNTISGNTIGADASGTMAMTNQHSGISMWSGPSHNIIEDNLISGNGDNGVEISSGTAHNIVRGNKIGTDVSGSFALANGADGVLVENGATYNVIGGDEPGERNLISGNNADGIDINGSGTMSNTVSGNYIGTNISGTLALGNGDNGVQVGEGASYNLIGGDTEGERNLISGNANIGISVSGSGTMSNTVSGNYIGTDVNGAAALGNTSNGVYISDGPQFNVVGGTTAAERNIISGSSTNQGIHIRGGHANTVIGNYIGVDASGAVALGNHYSGILINNGSQHNVVGGSTAGERNIISGNGGDGVRINGTGTMSNTVSGNYIGTDVNGTSALGNDRGGVEIRDGASDNLIGGDTAGERNLISGNSNVGVSIYGSATTNNTVSGNYIGTDVSGTSALSTGYIKDGVDIGDGAYGNVIGGDNGTPGGVCTGECNLISGNSGDGIWLQDAGAANTVSGNYIGTNVSGTVALSNGYSGVFVTGSTSNCTIGGDTPGERNLISGNDGGVGILGTSYITVSGNYIGTDASGTAAIGNFGAGVGVSGDNNLIGGVNTTPGSGCGGACNLISGNTMVGVDLNGSTGNTVSGNFVGTDAGGTLAVPNGTDGDGVYVHGGATYNTIGGDTPGERNLISGNNYIGVNVRGSGTISNTVSGNFIGTDVNGTSVLSNGVNGIQLSHDSSYTLVGGDAPGEGNLISGNGLVGVRISGAMSNTVSGNTVGTDVSGTFGIPNGAVGVSLVNGASDNLIGGGTLDEGNAIAHNGGGIVVDGAATLGNTISHNSIYANAAEGIGLTNGGNGELTAPSITGIAGTTITGKACANCAVEVFSDDDDEGRWFHGTTTADGSGHFVFTSTTPFTGTTVTATTTDADGNTSEFSPPPSISSIAPIQGTNDVPNEINVYGLGFVQGLSVTLHTTPTTELSVSYLNSSHLRATVPISLTAGSYDLTVTNPDGRSDTLAKAYIVFDAQVNNDDLYAQSHDLWNNPLTVRQGEQAGLGLVVHRQGGDQTLTDVVVHFYDGDPDAGGTFIFTGTIAQLAPRSSESTTQVPWTPASAGDYVIYALIDPHDAVTETVETNNTVSATITVLPQATDTTPPTVTAFAINGGADVTTVPTVTLTVSAEDNSGGSGVGAVRFVEFEFVQAAMLWVPVQSSDWLPYTTSYTWTLIDVAGARYLQAWVADKAGNISLAPAKDHINYTPPSDQIAQGQVRVYRQYAEAGQTLSVTVTPISGDPDLYIWSSTGISVGVSNNYTDTVDALSIGVAVSGTYQIEVYGYTAAEYAISITVIGSGADIMPDVMSGWPDSTSSKTPRSAPVVPVADEPPGQMAVPTAPVTGDASKVYLPLVVRSD